MEVTLSKLITCVSALLQEERNIDSTENANSDVARSLHFSETLIQALQVLEHSNAKIADPQVSAEDEGSARDEREEGEEEGEFVSGLRGEEMHSFILRRSSSIQSEDLNPDTRTQHSARRLREATEYESWGERGELPLSQAKVRARLQRVRVARRTSSEDLIQDAQQLKVQLMTLKIQEQAHLKQIAKGEALRGELEEEARYTAYSQPE
ncbi:MAG: hypothetical protein SGPRY_003661 [Prymnesium sp.]